MEERFEDLLKVLSTPIALRKPEMIQLLVNMTRNISFFSSILNELGEKFHYQTCEYLSCEYHPADTVIFN